MGLTGSSHSRTPRRWAVSRVFASPLRSTACLLALAIAVTAVHSSASAQGWGGWVPWGNDQRPPAGPREPVRPQPPPQQLPPATAPPAPGFSGPTSSNRPPICIQLEQRLHAESRSSSARDLLPRIEGDLKGAERALRAAQEQLERSNCYEYEFLVFGKSLRRTPACQNQAAQVETNRRRIGELEQQRQQIVQSGGRSLQEDLIRELARNNCGAHYQQQAARSNSGPFSSLWQDEDAGPGGGKFNYGATFRTVCVRLCDGAFFPVSFSTLPASFERDQELCQQKCAAPAELYYHSQNPGQGIEHAISHRTRQPYTTLRTAFRFKKEFVTGCSCKAAEYVPPGATPPPTPVASDRRADAQPAAGGKVAPVAAPAKK